MKKLIIFLMIITIAAVSAIFNMYLNYKQNYIKTQKENRQFDSYYEQEIYGKDLVTLINRAVDKNEKNEIQKDKKGQYIDNKENSIRIDIKFLDDNSIHSMEEIYNSGTSTFMIYYNEIKFKCTNVEYHIFNHNIKYMFFEQITE